MVPEIQSERIFEIHHNGTCVSFWLPDRRDFIQSHIANQKIFYEQDMLDEIGAMIERFDVGDGVLVDAGANIGNHTLFFAKILGRKVYSFEPLPRLYEILTRNIDLNGLGDKVFPQKTALGRKSGYSTILKMVETNLGGTALSDKQSEDRSLETADDSVLVSTLDEAEVINENVSLLKIDVEGMEADVLRGAQNLISKNHPLILAEVLSGDNLGEIQTVLAQYSYAPVRVFNSSPMILFASPVHHTVNVEECLYKITENLMQRYEINLKLNHFKKKYRQLTRKNK